MSLTAKQKGVRRGIIVANAIAILVLVGSALINPFHYDNNLDLMHKVAVVFKYLAVPGICLALSIAALAKHRFFTPEDIDGSGLSDDATEKAKILQSIIQNTLEQAVLALMVYLFWATVMPARFLSVIPTAAILFLLGRIFFSLGYVKGAPARSTGFGLTFFPTMLLLFVGLVTVVCQSIVLAG